MLIPIRDRNPHHSFPVVTLVLIAINVVVYVATAQGLLGGPDPVSVFRYGAVPCDVVGTGCSFPPELQGAEQIIAGRNALWSVLTSMFMHGGILHIGMNMLFLWVFGNNIEDRTGKVRFVVFYLICGVAAAYAHILLNTDSVIPVVGASGAISGVLGAYLVLFPHARVVSLVPLGFFFFTVELPASAFLIFWFVLQLFSGFSTPGGGGVAYAAHVGGFVAGWLLIRVFRSRRPARAFDPEDWFRT